MDFISNKRCKTENDNTDIISNLPREVLCYILSFLPTKYAAGTSILSTKWKNLLPLIPCLQLLLEDTHLLHPHPPSNTHLITFQNFVHNLLNVTLRDTPSIHSLTLICHEINDGQLIASWIIAALRLNIKRMDIQIQRLQNLKFLIDSLYGSNLVSLRLCLSFSHDATAFKDFKFSLPKLKRLSVQSMEFTLVNALLASCPMLRYLMLIDCYSFHPEERLQIRIPSLMYVELLNTLCWVNYLVDIDAPQLLYMSHWGHIASRNVNRTKYTKIWVGYLTYENNASRYTYYFDEKTAMLGKPFSGADVLWLSEACISMMLRQPHHLPRFEKMGTLCVTYMTVHGWKLLPSLIDSAPNLRNLCIRNVSDIKLFKSLKASVLDSVPIRLVKRTNKFYNFYIERK